MKTLREKVMELVTANYNILSLCPGDLQNLTAEMEHFAEFHRGRYFFHFFHRGPPSPRICGNSPRTREKSNRGPCCFAYIYCGNSGSELFTGDYHFFTAENILSIFSTAGAHQNSPRWNPPRHKDMMY